VASYRRAAQSELTALRGWIDLPGAGAPGQTPVVRYSVNIPNFGDFADARTVAKLAVATEQAGWDGLFIWDHVVHAKDHKPFGDPWMLLTAAALATTRIRLGTLVTPVPRRRPQQLARQVATLDAISGGRVIFGAGLGGPAEAEYGSFGEPVDAVVRAQKLDEGLAVIARFWTGQLVNHDGQHYQVRNVTLLPPTLQQPRPPVWIAGFWPNRPPMRRAARWDGAVPLFAEAADSHAAPTAAQVREVVQYLSQQRDGQAGGQFEIVVGGPSPAAPGAARDLIAPLADAGATWWDERQLLSSPDLDCFAPVLRRVEQGPPVL
jgi:alkanesulfonate monooxygenase SsuD/methylene tetrahydromethanopterin reductase-like flavin-dependent oxidoreductase (luciferase family)